METEPRRTFAAPSDIENQSSEDDNARWDDAEYKYISPRRLEKQAWFATRQRVMSDSDDDEEYDDESCSLESGDLGHFHETHRSQVSEFRSRPRTAPSRPRQPLANVTEPIAFSRPSRFRSQTVCPPDRKYSARTENPVGVGMSYADGSEIRHTVKSRDMSNYSHLKRCVVDQIDFIKQRDGIWSNARLYGAVTALGKFMDEHQFRYIFLPDHQRQWLADMVTRLDQWNNMQLPWSSEFLKHKAYNDRRKRNQERVDMECLRLINPQNFEKQQLEKRARNEIAHQEKLLQRAADQAAKQARLDRIENRTREPTRQSRVAQNQMPIEFRPPRNPTLARSTSPDNLVLRKNLKPQDPTKIPHRPFQEVLHDLHSAKLFGKGIHGRLLRKKSPKRPPISHSPSLPIRRATARAAPPRPKTAVKIPRSRSRSRKEYSEVSVAPKDLMELLDLIRDIERKQEEINGQLLLLKEDAKIALEIPRIAEAGREEKTGAADACVGPSGLSALRDQRSSTTRREKEVFLSPSPKSSQNSAKNFGFSENADFFLEGGATEPRRRHEVSKSKGKRSSDKAADRVVTAVYSDMNSEINNYVDRLVRQEFALSSSR